MEPLSQLDVQSPDHVSVITRDGKLIISVTKDGASVTLGFPVRNVFNTTPPVPLQQQPTPNLVAVKDTKIQSEYQREAGLAYLEKLASKDQGTTAVRPKPVSKRKNTIHAGNYKLNPQSVREIKLMLADKEIMGKFTSKQQAFEEIAKAYNVSPHTISNIYKGVSWNWLKV